MKDTGVAAFLESHRREVEPIGRESGLAWWNLATAGLKKGEKRSAERGKKEAAI